jgi:hypothetical protein
MSKHIARRVVIDLQSLALGIWHAFSERKSGKEALAQSTIDHIIGRLDSLEQSGHLLYLADYVGDKAKTDYLREMVDKFTKKTIDHKAAGESLGQYCDEVRGLMREVS